MWLCLWLLHKMADVVVVLLRGCHREESPFQFGQWCDQRRTGLMYAFNFTIYKVMYYYLIEQLHWCCWRFPNISVTLFLSSNVKHISVLKLRPLSVGVSLKFYLYLISRHISAFDDVTSFYEEGEVSFMNIKLSWHDYHLYESWN
jgi:hypothetical protein